MDVCAVSVVGLPAGSPLMMLLHFVQVWLDDRCYEDRSTFFPWSQRVKKTFLIMFVFDFLKKGQQTQHFLNVLCQSNRISRNYVKKMSSVVPAFHFSLTLSSGKRLNFENFLINHFFLVLHIHKSIPIHILRTQ